MERGAILFLSLELRIRGLGKAYPQLRAGRAQTFLSIGKLLLLIKMERLGEEGESAEAGEKSAVQFSVLGWAVESDRKGRDLRCG